MVLVLQQKKTLFKKVAVHSKNGMSITSQVKFSVVDYDMSQSVGVLSDTWPL